MGFPLAEAFCDEVKDCQNLADYAATTRNIILLKVCGPLVISRVQLKKQGEMRVLVPGSL